MGFQRKGILHLTGDPVFTGDQFRGFAHVQTRDGIAETKQQTDPRCKVGWPKRAHRREALQPCLGSVQLGEFGGRTVAEQQRVLRHAFCTADHKDVAASGHEFFIGLRHSLHAGSTVA